MIIDAEVAPTILSGPRQNRRGSVVDLLANATRSVAGGATALPARLTRHPSSTVEQLFCKQ